MEAGRRRGDLPAHQPFLSASSHGNRVGVGFRRSHFTLFEEGESVTLLAISGGTGEKLSRERNLWEDDVFCI